jgi:hypothetical protein
VVAWLPLSIVTAACMGRAAAAGMERVGRAFLVQPPTTEPGPYRLYSDATGRRRLIEERVTRFQAEGTCVLYEADRRKGRMWLVAGEDDRRPYEVTPTPFREPWYLEPVGLRRYRRADDNGLPVIIVETLSHPALCARAAAQLGFGGVSPVSAAQLMPGTSKVNVNEVDTNGNTALHDAATFGTEGLVQALVGAGVSVDARNASGSTALHVAAIFDQPAAVGRLIAAGADVNARNAAGYTPLMFASRLDSAACARLLVQAGADAHSTNDAGQTLLQLAKNAQAAEVVEFLSSLER